MPAGGRSRDKEGFQVVETDLLQLEPRAKKKRRFWTGTTHPKRAGDPKTRWPALRDELGRAEWHDGGEKRRKVVV